MIGLKTKHFRHVAIWCTISVNAVKHKRFMRIKELLKNLILLISIIILFLAAIEGFFRIFYPHSAYSITYAPWGWTHVPNSKVVFYKERPELNFDLRKRPYPIPIHYNSKGLREFEYGYEKPDKTFRILLLGDSWAEDMGSYFENLHAKWLERKLNDMGYPYVIEVINGGHYAFDDAQEYMFYLKEGKKYSPDVVIVMFIGDEASPEYATIGVNGELALHYKEFTASQKLYRNIISMIRRKIHFGSFLLDRISRIKNIKSFLVKKGYKEKDAPVISNTNVDKMVIKGEDGFKPVDEAIWISFRKEVEEKDRGRLVFLSCTNTCLNEAKRMFLQDNKILVLEIDGKVSKDSWKLKDEELRKGVYDKFYDSHRFGYKANEKVADDIIEFMLQHELLPDRI